MATTIKTKIGQTLIEVSGETAQKAIQAIAPFTEAVSKIEAAGFDPANFELNYRQAKDYHFYELVSKKDGKRLPFGETKEGNRLFSKQVEDEYQGGNGGSGGGGGDDYD